MEKFKGTPGPWGLGEGWIDNHVSVDYKNHGAIALVLADMDSDHSSSESKLKDKRRELSANANLIAAAPDLLEALQDILWEMRVNGEVSTQNKKDARAAIDRALGKNDGDK